MKYTAKPVSVDAYRIKAVHNIPDQPGQLHLTLDEVKGLIATPAQLARMTPVEGDYVVVQEDGYTYLNPKAVFERKYSPASDLGALQRLRTAPAEDGE